MARSRDRDMNSLYRNADPLEVSQELKERTQEIIIKSRESNEMLKREVERAIECLHRMRREMHSYQEKEEI